MYHYRMKTKPILIVAVFTVAVACGVFIAACKTAKTTEKAAIVAFLKDFNTQVKAGHTKSALAFFEDDPNTAANKTLIKVLAGKSTLGGKGKPLFKVGLDVDAAGVDFTNPQAIVAVVPAKFKHDSVPGAASHINFTLHKVDGKQYKIVAAKVDDFASDYALYQNKVINATVPETQLFSAETLAAFRVAATLKTRYDSVPWFQHVDKKAWFYVIKGKMAEGFFYEDRRTGDDNRERSDFKMGLVGPDLKEIIPVEYDLIHNIGGTIDSLIEVEKAGKLGYYNMAGKLVVPAEYEQVLPLNDADNLALLKKGDDYAFLKKDYTISDKLVDFKVGDVLQKVKHFSGEFTLSDASTKNTMEYNDREVNPSLLISPAYMVELNLLQKFVDFPNPLRKLPDDMEMEDGSRSIAFTYKGSEAKAENWFQSAFYSVVDDYLGGRGGLYESKKLLLVDKRQNRILGFEGSSYFGDGEGGGELSGICSENSIKAINDTLFEFKTTAELDQDMLAEHQYIEEGPYYYYLKIEKGKLVALDNNRLFPTKYAKLDDSYLQSCYVITTYGKDYSDRKRKSIAYTTPEILHIMKNEIYAGYKYQFKDERWATIFSKYRYTGADTVLNANVDDSLTVIDKYNINWINNKLKITKPNTVASR